MSTDLPTGDLPPIDPDTGAPADPEPPKKRRRRRTTTPMAVTGETLGPERTDALLPTDPAATPAPVYAAQLAAARAEMEYQQQLHDLVEECILKILRPGIDYGVSHAKNCPQRLEPTGTRFNGPGVCPEAVCERKPDLWLPGAETIALRMGFMYGEPQIATDFMQALHLEVPWVAFRTPVIKVSTGEVVGYGIGARTLLQDNGDPNKMAKMGKKSSIIDAAKTAFGLSGRFAQDSPALDGEPSQAPLSPATPAPAPPPPPTQPIAPLVMAPPPPSPAVATTAAPGAAPAAPAPMEILKERLGLTRDDLAQLYTLAGWAQGEVLSPERKATLRDAVVALCQTELKAYIRDRGGWPSGCTPAEARTRFVLPWLAQRTQQTIPDRATPSLDTFVEFYALDAARLQRLYQCAGWTAGTPTAAHARQAYTLCEQALSNWIAAHGGWPPEGGTWSPEERRTHVFDHWLEALEQQFATTNPRPTTAQKD